CSHLTSAARSAQLDRSVFLRHAAPTLFAVSEVSMSFVRFKSTHRDGKPTHDNAFVLLEMPHSGTQGLRYRGHRMVDGLPILTARLTRFESDAVRRTVAKGVDAAVPLLSGYPELVRHPQIAGVRFTLARAFVDVNRSKEDVSGLAL